MSDSNYGYKRQTNLAGNLSLGGLVGQSRTRSDEISIISWNVNGIRAIQKKGFADWVENNKPDIICLQEIKISKEEEIPNELADLGFYSYWNFAEKPGYSGTAIFTRFKPQNIALGLGVKKFDDEGRVIIAEFSRFYLINGYFPYGGRKNERVEFKLKFCQEFLTRCGEIKQSQKTIVFCGDVNTAHKEIDLARPKNNKNKTGFLGIERDWLDSLLNKGYVDTFRHFHPDKPNTYSYWSQRGAARENNVGWRVDYFFVDSENISNVTSAFILDEISVTDHCPVGITLSSENAGEVFVQNPLAETQMSLF